MPNKIRFRYKPLWERDCRKPTHKGRRQLRHTRTQENKRQSKQSPQGVYFRNYTNVKGETQAIKQKKKQGTLWRDFGKYTNQRDRSIIKKTIYIMYRHHKEMKLESIQIQTDNVETMHEHNDTVSKAQSEITFRKHTISHRYLYKGEKQQQRI